MHFLSVLFMVLLPASQAFAEIGLTTGQGNAAQLQDIVSSLRPGSVLVIGEAHANSSHASQHIRILTALRAAGNRVGVGLEFLEFPFQDRVDAFRRNEMSESEFLKAVDWKGFDFKFYREQIRFPGGADTRALNAPRSLSSKIAKSGLASLSEEERRMLPPHFEIGDAEYFERFKAAMGAHSPAIPALDRYFLAQSLWDDTMAYQTSLSLARDPLQIFVIIVGDFHVQYGGGLPDRLRARGISDVKTLSQLTAGDDSGPHAKYGERADWVWVSSQAVRPSSFGPRAHGFSILDLGAQL